MSFLGDCTLGLTNSTCYNTEMTGRGIITGLVSSIIIGAACYIGFIIWRGVFKIYYARLVLPQVKLKPPPLRLGGHWQLWSWLLPVFQVRDAELLRSAGLDSLMYLRILRFGIMMFTPITVLGVAVLLPVNYTAGYFEVGPSTNSTDPDSNSTDVLTSNFMRMTMSNVPPGSGLLWLHFVFVYIFVAWTCHLLLQYSREFVALRQVCSLHGTRLAAQGLPASESIVEASVASAGLEVAKSQRLSRLASSRIPAPQELPLGRQLLLRNASSIKVEEEHGEAEHSMHSVGSVSGSRGGRGRLRRRSAAVKQQQYEGEPMEAVSAVHNGSITGSRAFPPDSGPCPPLMGAAAEYLSSRSSPLQHGKGDPSPAASSTAFEAHAAIEAGTGLAEALSDQQSIDAGSSGTAVSMTGQQSVAGPDTELGSHDIVASWQRCTSQLSRQSKQSLRSVAGSVQGSSGMQDSDTAAGAFSFRRVIWEENEEQDNAQGDAPEHEEGCEEEDAQLRPGRYTVLLMDESMQRYELRHNVKGGFLRTALPSFKRLKPDPASHKASLTREVAAIVKGIGGVDMAKVEAKRKQVWADFNYRMNVAGQTLTTLFGNDVGSIIPIYPTKEVDTLQAKLFFKEALWERLAYRLDQLEDKLASSSADALAADIEEGCMGAQSSSEADKDRPNNKLDGTEEMQADTTQQVEGTEGGDGFGRGSSPNGPVVLVLEKKQPQGSVDSTESKLAAVPTNRVREGGNDGTDGEERPLCGEQPHPAEHPKVADLKSQPKASLPKAKEPRLACCCGLGRHDPAKARHRLEARAQKLRAQLSKTEEQVEAARAALEAKRSEVLQGPPCPSFFVTFKTQEAASLASTLNLNPIQERLFSVMPAPDPKNVNWPTLQKGWWARNLRVVPVFFFILLIMLFPIGAFTGIGGQLAEAICPQNDATNSLSAANSWFCSGNIWATLFRNSVTSWLPSLLLSIYQAVVLPKYFFVCAQAEAQHVTLSALDLRCGVLFFYWNVFNLFLGALLGGSLASGIQFLLQGEANQFFSILGAAIPASSNFFINYVIFRAFALVALQLFFPNVTVLLYIMKWLHILPWAKTPKDMSLECPPRSRRLSRDTGIHVMSVVIVSAGYAVVSPLVLPFALIFFLLSWAVWRYQTLYVYEMAYDALGDIWSYAAHCYVGCLAVMVVFTSAMMGVKAGYAQSLIMLLTLLPFLFMFNRVLYQRYDAAVVIPPVVTAIGTKQVVVDPVEYQPPPLRKQGEGWHLEWGKAWEYWGMVRYGI